MSRTWIAAAALVFLAACGDAANDAQLPAALPETATPTADTTPPAETTPSAEATPPAGATPDEINREDPPAPTSVLFADPPYPDDCVAPEFDVTGEPPWRQYADYQDWFVGGCLVRIDVLADRPGPEHCGFQSVRVLITGDPLGTPYTTASDDIEYVRDADNVMGLAPGLVLQTTLPATAIDSGYRSASGEQLWTVPDDTSGVYVVGDAGVEWWPRAESVLCS